MPDSDENSPLSPNDSQSVESRMRRALGLQGNSRSAPQQRVDQARPRHRFVQDGGVPVVVLGGRGDNDSVASFKARIAELDSILEAERNAHCVTKRALHDAQTSVQALHTRLAHAEFAHGEALIAERRLRKEAEDALQSRFMPEVEQPRLPCVTEPKPAAGHGQRPERKTRPMRRPTEIPEPQPVKWWLPGYREKTR